MAEKRKKRRNGEGTWNKKTINGIVYHHYRNSSGKDFYGKTEKEVKEKIRKASSEFGVNSGNGTFGKYILRWLELKKTSIEITSYMSYLNAVNERLINYAGFNLSNVSMRDLTADMFQNYLNSLATGYSLNSIKKVWGLIKRCVEYGEAQGDIKPLYLKVTVKLPSEANVARKKKKISVPTAAEVNHIYKEAFSTWSNGSRRYGNGAYVVILIMYTGMRVSEAIGLQWKDVDLEKKTITVSQSLARIRESKNGKDCYSYKIKSAKTQNSCRTIPLPDRAVDALMSFSRYRTSDEDFVCVKDRTRGHYNNQEVESVMKRIVKNSQCKIKTYTPHSLRHGYGSILLSKGANINVVAKLLGHRDVAFTFNVYIDVFEEDKRAEVAKLNGI